MVINGNNGNSTIGNDNAGNTNASLADYDSDEAGGVKFYRALQMMNLKTLPVIV